MGGRPGIAPAPGSTAPRLLAPRAPADGTQGAGSTGPQDGIPSRRNGVAGALARPRSEWPSAPLEAHFLREAVAWLDLDRFILGKLPLCVVLQVDLQHWRVRRKAAELPNLGWRDRVPVPRIDLPFDVHFVLRPRLLRRWRRGSDSIRHKASQLVVMRCPVAHTAEWPSRAGAPLQLDN